MQTYSPDWIGPFKGWCQSEIEAAHAWIARLDGTERIGENGEDMTEEMIASLREEIASLEGAISQAEGYAYRI